MMKNLITYLFLIGLVFIINSCSPSGLLSRYCAQCEEVNSGYVASDYCGTNLDVETYIDEMESYDPDYPNQYWVCIKVKE